MTTCTLCDLPIPGEAVTDPDLAGTFCCRGCLEVARSLGTDVPAEAIRRRAAPAAESPSVPADADTAFLDVAGMHCRTCELFIEGVATDHEGIYDAEASYATEMVKLVYDPSSFAEEELPAVVSGLGYRASVAGTETARDREERFEVDRIRTVLGLLGAMAVMVFYVFFLYPTYLGAYPMSFLYEAGTSLIVFVPIPLLSAFVLFFVGFPILRGAYVSLRTGTPNMDVLVAFGATAAYGYSVLTLLAGGRVVYFDVAVVIVAVVTVGNYVEAKIKRRAVGALTDVERSRPTSVRVRRDGAVAEAPRDALEPGDELVVTAGDPLPVDGRVVAGELSVDEALISGEAAPRAADAGARVIGGSSVLAGEAVVAAGDPVTSTLDQLVGQMWAFKSAGGAAQRLADRIAAVFVPAILVLAGLVAGADLLVGEPLATAVVTGVAVLVVSCPCTFGLATPLAVAVGVDRAARDGTVITNPVALERAPDVDVVALDKTGTLSTRDMAVAGVTTAADDADGAVGERLLARAAALETGVEHPIAAAVVAAAPAADLPVADRAPGPRGVVGTVAGTETIVGHPSMFRQRGWALPDAVEAAIERTREEGAIATVVGWDGRARGVLEIRDELRPGWEATVTALAEGGRTVVVLTGDDASSVRPFEAHPAIDHVFSGMLPQAKAATIRKLEAEVGAVAMVGDGDNDAPALATADLGIAMATGRTLAAEAADATVLDRDLDAIVDLLERGRTMRRRIRQNLGWALAYNAVTIPLAAVGLVDPLIAAVAMGTSSVLVVLNSTR